MDASASPILSKRKLKKKLEESAIVGNTTFFYSLTRKQLRKATKHRDKTGLSLLHLAVINGHTEVVKILVKNKYSYYLIDHEDQLGQTPMHLASRSGNADIFRLLIENGADVNIADIDGKTALHCAAEKGSVDIAKFSVYNSAYVNARDEQGNMPLHHAACIGNLELCELLIKYGAVIDARNKIGQFPLQIAAIHAHTEVVVYLIRCRAEWEELNEAVEGCETVLESCPRDLQDAVTETLKEMGEIVDSLQEKRRIVHI